MAVYDYNGTTYKELSKIYDYNGANYFQQSKVYDYNGTTYNLLYTSWDGELLVGGDEIVDVTGGYDPTKYTGSTWMLNASNNGSAISTHSGSGTWHKTGTVNKINVSEYSKITFTISCPNGCYTLNTHFGLYNNQTSDYHNDVVHTGDLNYTNGGVYERTYTLDISSLTGTYFLALYAYSGVNYPVLITNIKMS